uniref:Putative uncharacterized protein n=1 Tax=Acidianus filamentous virus 1 TaxID=235266 RepID=UPI0001BE6217
GAKLNRKLRQDSTDRYKTKLYLWRNLGGLIPEDMAISVTESITADWKQYNDMMSKVRNETLDILKTNKVATEDYIGYIAFAEELAHQVWKNKNSSPDPNTANEASKTDLESKYSDVYGLDVTVLDAIYNAVIPIIMGGGS